MTPNKFIRKSEYIAKLQAVRKRILTEFMQTKDTATVERIQELRLQFKCATQQLDEALGLIEEQKNHES
jgi:hypothetical protein